MKITSQYRITNYFLLVIMVYFLMSKIAFAQNLSNDFSSDENNKINTFDKSETERNIRSLKSIYNDNELIELIQSKSNDNNKVNKEENIVNNINSVSETDMSLFQKDQKLKTTDNKKKFEPSFNQYNYTVFFKPEEFKQYLKTIWQIEEKIYLNGAEDLINQFDNIDNNTEISQEREIIFPYFHIISLIYQNNNNWSVK